MNASTYIAIDFETPPIPFFEKKNKKHLSSSGHPRLAKPILISRSDGNVAFCGPPEKLTELPKELVFHNATFDLRVGMNGGVFAPNIGQTHQIHCICLMARIYRSDYSPKLKDLAEQYLGVKSAIRYEAAVQASHEAFEEYAKKDALFTAQLYPFLKAKLEECGQWDLYESVELPFSLLNLECENNGFLVNRSLLKSHSNGLNCVIETTRNSLGNTTNWNSPKQVKKKLFGDFELPLTFQRGKLSTSRNAIKPLVRLDYRIAKLLDLKGAQAQLRQLETLRRFIDPSTESIHPYINSLGADTGRCTSSSPNLQNINRESALRELFIARPGCKLVVIDFSQIEPRVLAHFLKPSAFSELFWSQEDFYNRLARDVFSSDDVMAPRRSIAKQVVLATFYGMGEKTLAENLKVDVETARGYLNRFFSAFPEITKYRNQQIQTAGRVGFAEGLLNRRRYISGLTDSDEYTRAKAERKVLNAIVQGSAATLFKFKLVELRKQLDKRVRFLLHVHDEVILEAPEEAAYQVFSQSVMALEAPVSWFSIPLKVEGGIGDSWAEAKSNPTKKGGE